MFLNLENLRSELGQKIKNTAISNARLDRWLNLAQDDILVQMDPGHLIVNGTFDTVADQRMYYLDIEFRKIMSIVDTTNEIPLEQVSESELEGIDANRGDSGDPYLYSIFGYDWVIGQPTIADTVTIVSNEAADTTQKVRINGTVGGVDDTELLTLNGLVGVAGTKLFSAIQSIVKDVVTTGIVSVTETIAGTALATLAPNALSGPRQPVNLYPIPSAVLTMRYRAIRRPKEMINVQDFPDLPVSFHELVLIGAAIRGHRDLMRPTIAKDVLTNEWTPMFETLKKQMGQTRGKYSPVIIGGVTGSRRVIGRLGDRFGD